MDDTATIGIVIGPIGGFLIREIRVIRGSNLFWFRPEAGRCLPWFFSFVRFIDRVQNIRQRYAGRSLEAVLESGAIVPASVKPASVTREESN